MWCIFISRGLARAYSGCEFLYSPNNLAWILQTKVRAYSKNNIHSLGKVFSLHSERLSDYSFDAISLHRAAKLTVNAYPQPTFKRRICHTDQAKTFCMQPFSPAVDLIVLPSLPNQAGFGKPLADQHSLHPRNIHPA
jgi:hypothetical protein